jgi:hypothetical protein
MTTYAPPLRDIRFALDELAELPKIATLPGFEEANADLIAVGTPFAAEGQSVAHAVHQAAEAVAFLLKADQDDPRLPYASAVPFLHLMGTVVGGHVLLRAAKAAAAQMAAGKNDPYWPTKIALARFYAAHVLPQADAAGLP